MTAQDTIPEDIMQAAYDVALEVRQHIACVGNDLINDLPHLRYMIAKAILAERQRQALAPSQQTRGISE